MKRLLSFIVAIAMVASLVTCFSVSFSADTALTDEQITAFEKAYADVMAFFEGMPEISHSCAGCVEAPDEDKTGVFQTAMASAYARYETNKTQENVDIVYRHFFEFCAGGDGTSHIFASTKLEEVGRALMLCAVGGGRPADDAPDYNFMSYKDARDLISQLPSDVWEGGYKSMSDFNDGTGYPRSPYNEMNGGESGGKTFVRINAYNTAKEAYDVWCSIVDYVNENCKLQVVADINAKIAELKEAAEQPKVDTVVDGESLNARDVYAMLQTAISNLEGSLENIAGRLLYSDLASRKSTTVEWFQGRVDNLTTNLQQVNDAGALELYNQLDDAQYDMWDDDIQAIKDAYVEFKAYFEGYDDLQISWRSDDYPEIGEGNWLQAVDTLYKDFEAAPSQAKFDRFVQVIEKFLSSGDEAHRIFKTDKLVEVCEKFAVLSTNYKPEDGDTGFFYAKPDESNLIYKSSKRSLAIADVTWFDNAEALDPNGEGTIIDFVKGSLEAFPRDLRDDAALLKTAETAKAAYAVWENVVKYVNESLHLKVLTEAEALVAQAKEALKVKKLDAVEDGEVYPASEFAAVVNTNIGVLEERIANTPSAGLLPEQAGNGDAVPSRIGLLIADIQIEVDNLAQAVENYNALEDAADKSALETALAAAKELNADLYVDFSAVSKAIEDATALLSQSIAKSEQAKIDSAVAAINEAVSGLVMKSADTAALDKAIADAKAKDANAYTNYDAVAKAIADAEALKATNPKIIDQDAVDAAVKAINDAVAALTEKPAEPDNKDDDNNNNKPADGDNNKPADGNNGNQNTGDAMTALYMMMLFVSLAGIATVVTLKVKNRA